jgi:hypothetical protein
MADQVTFNALRALDADGNPVAGAKAYFYETGTTTPVTVYTDTALSVAAASPLVADANGYFDQVFYNGAVSLKVVVDDADDVELFTLDPVATAATASAAASGITFTPTAEIAQSNVQDAIEQVQSNVDDAKTGSDAGIVTGTAGAADNLAKWNGDGDLVDAGVEVLDEDDMASDSAAAVPTQQSTKAYVDTYAMGTVVVAKTTTTAVANVDISVPAGCNRLEIDILDIVPVTDNANLHLQCGNSGVDSGASDYAYGYTTLGGSTGTSSGDTKIIVQPSSGSDTGENQGGTISVLGPRDSGITTKFVWNTAQEKSDGAFYTITGSARRNTAQDDDTVRILFSSGNIETITYTVRSFTD